MNNFWKVPWEQHLDAKRQKLFKQHDNRKTRGIFCSEQVEGIGGKKCMGTIGIFQKSM